MEQESAEILRALNDAREGYWLPFTILAGAFSLIILLLLYIWNQMIKGNDLKHLQSDRRHDSQDKMMKTAMENQATLTDLVTRHDVDLEYLKK